VRERYSYVGETENDVRGRETVMCERETVMCVCVGEKVLRERDTVLCERGI